MKILSKETKMNIVGTVEGVVGAVTVNIDGKEVIIRAEGMRSEVSLEDAMSYPSRMTSTLFALAPRANVQDIRAFTNEISAILHGGAF